MDQSALAHLIYTSTAAPGMTDEALRVIVEDAQLKNRVRSLTGLLIYSEGSFFQVLEGDESQLAQLFKKISADTRHSRVTQIISEPISRRIFADWTMGLIKASAADLQALPGFSDFFEPSRSLSLQPGRAQKILHAFINGRWRNVAPVGGV